jgi:diguanylate cyclase (GGDEF)-like protein
MWYQSCNKSGDMGETGPRMRHSLNFVRRHGQNWVELAKLHRVRFVGLVFAALIAAQALGFFLLGTGIAGQVLSGSLLVVESFLALVCSWIAFRRARGTPALFWFLFSVALAVLLVPTTIHVHDILYPQIVSDSTLRLLYCLYGAPILMMLFLPTDQRARVKSEIFLDLFQISIVVSLVYSTFFFLPALRMMPDDALLHNISISDVQSWLLLLAAFIRFKIARASSSRGPLLRLTIFVLVCAIATFTGDWIDLRHYVTASRWFDLGWAIPQLAAALLALTWVPAAESDAAPVVANFPSFLGTNLALVALLSCIALLTDRWKAAHGAALTNAAIAASLVAFTLRLALTQFHQQQEIAERKAAQLQLTASNERVNRLLDDARRQTSEITQISEIGSLLQACASREEVFRLIPERLRRLFSGASGCVALLNTSKNRAESVAKWGISPIGQIFSPEECWALRRGRTHIHPGGSSGPRCAHLAGEGPSVCIPLIANGETIGTLSVQGDDFLNSPASDRDEDSNHFGRHRQLAAAIAEHVAVSVANLTLRETLRVQAVRDPLTGLYNRRYMQEFLDRELQSARRKNRPVAVLMLDLDHFKRYNDNFGHSAGDKALAAFGDSLLRCVRADDVACRYGGEEFVLIFPECSLRQATVRAEEIRKRLSEYCVQHTQQSTRALTVSIGVAAFDETTDRLDLLLTFADEALYEAKRAGRNRVVVARRAAGMCKADFSETHSTNPANPIPDPLTNWLETDNEGSKAQVAEPPVRLA